MDTNIISYFDNHPSVDVFYFTSDGFAFFTENDAINHSINLEDETVTTISRLDTDQQRAEYQRLIEEEMRAENLEFLNEEEYDPLDELDAE